MKDTPLHKASVYLAGIIILASQITLAATGYNKATFVSKEVTRSAVFMENNNIVPDYNDLKIRYFTKHDNIGAYFTDAGVVYKVVTFAEPNDTVLKQLKQADKKDADKDGDENDVRIKKAVVFMHWEGANPQPEIVSGTKAEGYYTYLAVGGNSYKTLQTDGYKTITYKDLYPGIDVEYSFPEKGGMEYNLVVHPGADVSKVKMTYSGAQSIAVDADGNITVNTGAGTIIEHAPVSYSGTGHRVGSHFVMNNNTIRFEFPLGYDRSQTLTVDPWVVVLTTLPPLNLGLDVDYDFAGNLFVYGAGTEDENDLTNFFKITKYNSNGTALWTFNGSVGSINWNTADIPQNLVVIGNFIVDKITSKVYIGKSDLGGTTSIRLNANGQYDNWISALDTTFIETWGYGYDCTADEVLALGGGTQSVINMGVLNPITGAVSESNITGILTPGDYYQDIICGAYDSAGNLYVIMDDGLGILPYTNTMYRLNTAYNGYVWTANSNFTPFTETNNEPFWGTQFNFSGTSNWFNCLAANGSYLYYYDGLDVAAFSLATGASAGNATTVPGYTALAASGIAVDKCNHVYIGGIGAIKTFTFDGTNFTPGASIPLGGAFNSDTIHDIKYDASNNLLYVTGSQMVGTYTATLSITCNTNDSYTLSTTHNCDSATVHIAPSATLNPVIFTIIWTDSAGNVLSQLVNTADTVNMITGLGNGTYYVQVQWNTNCGGTAFSDSAVINCNVLTVTVTPDTTICLGQSVILTATPSITGGTYLWTPGGATTPSITVSPGANTIYTVTYSVNSLTATATDTVNVNTNPVTVTVDSATECSGNPATLVATVSVPGGTYLWSTGAIVNAITVTPGGTTAYTVTYTLSCGSATATGLVTLAPSPALTLAQNSPCGAGSGTITINPSGGTSPYQYSLNGGAYQNPDSFTGLNAGLDTIQIKDANGCTANDTISVTITAGVILSLQSTPATCAGGDGKIIATASTGVAPYQYSLNGGAYQSADSFTALNAGFYTVQVEGANNCTASDTITVATLNGITLTLQSTNPTCVGGNGLIIATTLGSTPPYQYSMNGGALQNSDTFSGLNVGFYTVSAQSSAGCQATDTVTLTNSNNVNVHVLVTNPLCAGETGEIIATGAGGTAPYQFSLNGGSYQVADSFTSLAAGTYTITSEDANSCTATATATVNQAPSQLILVPTVTPDSCPGFSDGTMTAGQSGGTSPYSFAWSNNGPDAATDPGLPKGNYTVTVTDANGCTASATEAITELPGVAYTASVHNIFCVPLQNGFIQIAVTSGTPPISYLWSTGSTDSAIYKLSPGNYALTITSGGGCVADTSFTIVNDSAFSLSVFPTDTTIELGTFAGIRVIPNGDDISFMYWDPNEFILCDTCAATSVSPIQTMYYTARVTSDSGCTGIDSILVTVIPYYNIFVPNAFTPNGDGNNDYFSVYGEKEDWKQFSVKLFDRWGEKVYESNDENFQWDGKYKGKLMDPQVLVWEIHLTYLDNHSEKLLKGSVTLAR